MRKILAVLLFTFILVVSLTACSSGKTETTSTVSSAASENHLGAVSQNDEKPQMTQIAEMLNGKTLVEVYRSRPAEVMQEMYNQGYAEYLPGFKLKGFSYVDGLTDGLLMLKSGRADVLQVMQFTADYLVNRESNLVVYKNPGWDSLTQMIFNPNGQAQFDKVNAAIKAMLQDGTLVKLEEQWITNLPAGQEPAGGALPKIAGADTIKVGISGDEPPLDYIAADGRPGGFNIAVLSEISQRAGINIELTTVSGAGRFAALESRKIDAFLWHNSSASLNGMARTSPNIVKIGETSLLATENYLNTTSAVVLLKN
jgi:ABC-type amino acid transport substrate-binding protein